MKQPSETASSIFEWATQTFGYHDAYNIAVRGHVELAELMSAVSNLDLLSEEDRRKIALEAADVYIVLCQIPQSMSYDPEFYNIHNVLVNSIQYDPLQLPMEPLPPEDRHLIEEVCLDILNDFIGVCVAMRGHRRKMREALVEEHLTKIIRGLIQVCLFVDLDLQANVEEKMKINRARKWGTSPTTGMRQHV